MTRVWNPESIVQVALQLVEKGGFDALTMRSLAKRLRVENPALYWHFRGRQELVNAMAAAMVEPLSRVQLSGSWRERVEKWARSLRRIIASQRDGARIVAEASLKGSAFQTTQHALIAGLRECGLTNSLSLVAVVTVCDFTLGSTWEELAEPASKRPGATRMFNEGLSLVLDGVQLRVSK